MKQIVDFLMKKGIGLFVIAILTAFAMTGVIEYMQVFIRIINEYRRQIHPNKKDVIYHQNPKLCHLLCLEVSLDLDVRQG